MYPKTSRQKAKSGSIRVKDSNNRLQLVFTHGGKRHYVSLGLSNTPLNRKLAQDKAFEIQRDIEYGEFDPTYAKYTINTALTTVDPVTPISVSVMSCLNYGRGMSRPDKRVSRPPQSECMGG